MVIKGEQGERITEKIRYIEEMEGLFINLLNIPQPISNQGAVSNPIEGTDDQEIQPPTHEELNDTIKKLKNNKAAGTDNIISEFLKHVD
jgi:hypothetical protein